MTVFNKIIAFFTALAVAVGGIACLFKPKIPKAVSSDELMNMDGIFDKIEPDEKLYAVTIPSLSRNERYVLECLQGLVNKDKVRFMLVQSSIELTYLKKIEPYVKEIITTDSEGAGFTFESVIKFFSDYITDKGFVLYRDSDFAEGLNTACNYATVKGWLAVPVELKETVEKCGLKMVKDISEDEYDYKFLKKFFNEYKGEFSSKGIVHIKTAAVGLRDFAIQQGLYICYTGADKDGRRFLKKVLNKTAENGIVLGWCEDEKHFVKFISKLGYSIIPSDHSHNLSVLNSFDCETENIQTTSSITPDPDKHYISLIFSDGDNVQWMTNGYSEYYRGQNIERDYPITWGIPNTCRDICSATYNTILSAYRHNGDCFMAGPSGIGYALPSSYEEKSMNRYTTLSASAMLKSNLRVACILDDKPNAFAKALFTRKFDYYSRFDNIDGGIIFLDPHMYTSGAGRVWFSNDKPFLTVKTALWAEEGYSGATKEWMQEQADIINSYTADNNSINGYSAICIHAWSVTPENLDYFVSLLDSHIEIVNVNELITMITENVPHKTAQPE